MRNLSILCFLVLTVLLQAYDEPISFSGGMEAPVFNPALLSADAELGLGYRFDTMDEPEQLLTLRLPRWFSGAWDFEKETGSLSSSISPIRNLHIGLQLDNRHRGRSRWNTGLVWRPMDQLSVGAVVEDVLHREPPVLLGLAVRPWKHFLTLFAQQHTRWDEQEDFYSWDHWFAGVSVEPFAGFDARFSINEDEYMQFTMSFCLGNFTLGNHTWGKYSNRYNNRQFIEYTVQPRPSLFQFRGTRYRMIDLTGGSDDLFRILPDPASAAATISMLIDDAARDPQYRGVYIRLAGQNHPLAALEEIRRAVVRCQAKKEVVCLFYNGGVKEYLLASACEKIAMPPDGFLQTELDIPGSNELSGSRELGDLIRETIEKKRNMKPGALEQSLIGAHQAKQLGFVDQVSYEGEIERQLAGYSEGIQRWKMRFRSWLPDQSAGHWYRQKQIAVIPVHGLLARTDGPEPGALERLRSQIDEVTWDASTAAVVLHIDSEGGDAMVCGTLYNHIFALASVKPVVACIGSRCTGGAMLLASSAKQIFTLASSRLAGLSVSTEHFSSSETADSLASALEERLLSRIVRARGIPESNQVLIGNDAVYTGQEAVKRGLADDFGSLHEAIRWARKQTGLPKWSEIRYYPSGTLKKKVTAEPVPGIDYLPEE